MKRVAWIYPSFAAAGGGETYTINALQALAQCEFDVDLWTCDYNNAFYSLQENPYFKTSLLEGRGFLEGVGGTWRMIRRLSDALKPYDVVFAGTFPANVWAALGSHRRPVIWLCQEPKRNLYPQIMYAEAYGLRPDDYRKSSDYLHGQRIMSLFTRDAHVLLPYSVRAKLQRQLDHAAVRRTHHVLTNSPYIAAKVAQIYRHRSVHNVWAGVLPNAQTATYEPLIIVPSRLEKIKNIETVLYAVQQLVRTGDWLEDWQVVIIGDGTDAERLRTLARVLEVEAHVSFSGYITSEARDMYYARASWVVYPSLAEPLGLPIAEAAMSYKATIADAHGGPATMIRDGESGLLINMNQPQALAEALHWAMRHPQKAQHWGQAAYAHLAPTMRYDHWAINFCHTVHRLIDDM